ncbi:MAG: hypothetical protein ACLQIB_06295 [Isosphaeraceae bacterium]
MRKQLIAVVSSVLTVLGVSQVFSIGPRAAQNAEAEGPARPLEEDSVPIRLIMGIGDSEPTDWSGQVSVDKGEVVSVEGVRFRAGDEVTGKSSWKASSRLIRKTAARIAPAKAVAKALAKARARARTQVPKKALGGPSTYGPDMTPNGVIVTLKDAAGATLKVETAAGRFEVAVDRLADGSAVSLLGDRVRAQRVLPHSALLEGPGQDDIPAAAADAAASTVWIAYVHHEPRGPELLPALTVAPAHFADYAPTGGGDQVRLIRFTGGQGRWQASAPLDVTQPNQDVWRPAVAAAADGGVTVVWTEKRHDNWDVFGRRYDPRAGSFSPVERLTDQPGTDTDAVLATASDGTIWMAWQAWRGGQADIELAPLAKNGKLGAAPIKLSEGPADEWSPSIAADQSGRLHVAFDSYAAGNYDVILRSREPDGTLSQPLTVAGTAAFEARPSVAADARGRVWVAYEERAPNWGKDAVNLLDGKGSSLYRAARVIVACVDGQRLLRAPDPIERAPETLKIMNSYPRLLVDRAGRPWLIFRHRQEAIWGNNAVFVTGAVWIAHATTLSGPAWSAPQPLTRSDGLLDGRAALVEVKNGPVLAFYSTDGRLRREVEMNPSLARRYFTNQGTPPGVFNVDLEASALVAAASPLAEPRLSQPPAVLAADQVHPGEALDLRRIRAYRIEAGGKSYRLWRGEFHRHCEISADGGADGSLEDMWRYALDAAQLDWIGNGDHDNGGGKEYTWWLIQKTTDMYTVSPRFIPMFTYERSVAYPHGHRNVMFDHRGVRTLPRLVGAAGVVDNDTPMLYDYLKEHNGICASHTSATGMGTDWRDVNAQFEPFVEIYQGHRQSYEYLGAPRSARRASDSIGGWQPLGMVWNALAMQYRLGFQASSDHISTHISYAIALAEDTTRAAVLEAFKNRHCYAATDNIVMDVRSGGHLMGDEFDARGPVQLKVLIHGTGPIARIDIIKDFKYAFSTEPHRDLVEFQWTDAERGRPAGLSWYYVRAIQEDGELAWASPIWVHTLGEGN